MRFLNLTNLNFPHLFFNCFNCCQQTDIDLWLHRFNPCQMPLWLCNYWKCEIISSLLAKIIAFWIYLESQFWHIVCLKYRLMKPRSRYTSSHVPPPNSIFQSCCTAMGILRTWELLSTLHYMDINIFCLNWTIPRRYFSPFFNKFWFWDGARNARIYKMLNIIFLKTPPTWDCPYVFLQKCNFQLPRACFVKY